MNTSAPQEAAEETTKASVQAETEPASSTAEVKPQPPAVEKVSKPSAPADANPPSSTWRVMAWLALLLLALSGVILSASLWVRMNNAQAEVNRHLGEVLAQQRERQARVQTLQTQVNEAQARLASAEARVSELSLQRSQLEELVRGLSRSRDELLLQDLESAIRQAMTRAEVTGSVQPLLAALQVGMARVARSPDASLSSLQQAMAQDLNDLQQLDLLDVPNAVRQLSSIIQGIDGLPMGVMPAERPSAVLASMQALPEPAVDPQASVWRRWGDWVEWKLSTWWLASRDQLQALVRVRKVSQADAIALTPEQAIALGSQLKLRLLGARVAILNGQRTQVLADLDSVKSAVNAFAQLETPEAQVILKQLSALRQAVLQSTSPRPTNTLQALALAASQ